MKNILDRFHQKIPKTNEVIIKIASVHAKFLDKVNEIFEMKTKSTNFKRIPLETFFSIFRIFDNLQVFNIVLRNSVRRFLFLFARRKFRNGKFLRELFLYQP